MLNNSAVYNEFDGQQHCFLNSLFLKTILLNINFDIFETLKVNGLLNCLISTRKANIRTVP